MAKKYQRLMNLPMISKNFGFGIKFLQQQHIKRGFEASAKNNQSMNLNADLLDMDSGNSPKSQKQNPNQKQKTQSDDCCVSAASNGGIRNKTMALNSDLMETLDDCQNNKNGLNY